LLQAMQKDSGIALSELNVDGGAIANDFLAQFQADVLQTKVNRPQVLESTALGAALLAGLHIGYWTKEDLFVERNIERQFVPTMNESDINKLLKRWHKAVERSKQWVETDDE